MFEEPLGLFSIPQYRPGVDPLPEPVGPQYRPGIDPPNEPIGPQFVPSTRARSDATEPTDLASQGSVSSTNPATPTTDPAAAATGASPAVTAAIVGVIGRTEAAFDAAARDPDEPSRRDALAATTVDGSQAEDLWLGAYDAAVAAGRRNLAPADFDNTTTLLDGTSVLADPSGTVAIAMVCSVSGDTIIETDAGEAVELASGWWAVVQLQTFAVTADGTWQMSAVVDQFRFEGARECEEPASSAPPSAPPHS